MSPAAIYNDSKYVLNAVNKVCSDQWKGNGWTRTRTENAENGDLWSELLEQCGKHMDTFKWVKGHAGNSENERCNTCKKHCKDFFPTTR